MDIAFLLDSSASMSHAYTTQSKVVEKIASQYKLSPNGSHASILVYSNNAQIELILKDGASINSVRQNLGNLPFLGLDTRLDRGLYLARLALFVKKYGARENVPKILYVFTDGEQSTLTEAALAQQAKELRKLGVQIVVIAIGGAVDRDELQTVTSSKIYYMKSFKELLNNDDLIRQMVNHTHVNLREFLFRFYCS